MSKNTQQKRVNPEVYEQAKQFLTQEQMDEYKKAGEKMYNSVDFTTSEVLNNPEEPLVESIAYITEAVKSGLHPCYLQEVEKQIMEKYYGETWYKQFNYESLEL
jgi:hypothetical protein